MKKSLPVLIGFVIGTLIYTLFTGKVTTSFPVMLGGLSMFLTLGFLNKLKN